MKFLSQEADVFHAKGRRGGRTDRQADMPNLIVAFAILRTRLKITHAAHIAFKCFCTDLRTKSELFLK